MIRVHRFEQRTPEWIAAHAGRLTSSEADALYAQGRGSKESVARRDLRLRLAIETLTGAAVESDHYVSRDMQRGIDCEPPALNAYEALTGVIVDRAGFIDRLDMAVGYSPDGIVVDADERITGLVELKCPKSATHVAYIRGKTLPDEYLPQCAHALFVTGADWLDFVSWDDRLPPHLQLFRVRVTPRDVRVSEHAERVARFLAEVAVEARELAELRAAA